MKSMNRKHPLSTAIMAACMLPAYASAATYETGKKVGTEAAWSQVTVDTTGEPTAPVDGVLIDGTGDLTWEGGSATVDDASFGVTALGGKLLWKQGSDTANPLSLPKLTVLGEGRGISAIDGGTVELRGVHVTTAGQDGYGLVAEDPGSTMKATAVDVMTAGSNAFALVAMGAGATLEVSGSTARSAMAAAAAGADDGGVLTIDSSTVTSEAADSYGINAQRGGTVNVKNGSQISAVGANAYGIRASDAGSALNVDSSTVTADGHGAVVMAGATATIVNGSSVKSLAADTAALYVADAGSKATVTDSALEGTYAAASVLDGASLEATNAQLVGGIHGIQFQGALATTGLTSAVVCGGSIQSSGASIYGFDGTSSILVKDGAVLTSDGGVLVAVKNIATLNATFSNIQAQGDVVAEIAGEVGIQLSDNTTLTGAMSNATNVTVDAGSLWSMSATSDTKNLNVAGTIAYAAPVNGTFSQLEVANKHVGAGGTIVLNTVLGSDSSPTDKLVVHGTTEGSTLLTINNAGGAGAYTTADGIEVVDVGNAAGSTGTFALSGRVVAGAYEYLLAQGGKTDPADGDWYLRSEAPPPSPEPVAPVVPEPEPIAPVIPEPEPIAPIVPEPVVPITPAPEGPAPGPVYRPEIGAYLANQHAAEGMFNHALHDRVGQLNFAEGLGGEGSTSAAWMRIRRDQFDARSASAQIDAGTDTDVLQVGGEFSMWTEGNARFHLGGMASIGRATTDAVSIITGNRAKGRVKGYGIGVYGTWYADASNDVGLYLDGWMQYGRFQNRVMGDLLGSENYDSRGLSGSLEAGYAIRIRQTDQAEVFVQPQAQVIYDGLRTDRHVEANGTRIDADAGGVTTRVGARIYGNAATTANRVQPFAELNWLHSGGDESVSFNDSTVNWAMPKDVYEGKFGAQLELSTNWTGWGHLGFRQAAGDYRNVEGQIGVMRRW